MRGVIVQGCYRGALLKRQPGAGHQGYRVGGRSAIAAVKQRLPGNGDADGAITQLMLGGGSADLPVLPRPGFAAFLPVDGETKVRLRPVRQRGQLHEHRSSRRLAVDNDWLLTGITFPVVQ